MISGTDLLHSYLVPFFVLGTHRMYTGSVADSLSTGWVPHPRTPCRAYIYMLATFGLQFLIGFDNTHGGVPRVTQHFGTSVA
jgi:hypothetical protein